jgi:acyl-coenzyme A synthetase/AMP-(fatty) acid ligase
VNAIINRTAIIFPLKGAPPSARSLAEIVKRTKVDAALVVPMMIEEMSRSPELLEDIAANVDTMVYSGGDVPQGCGDVVAARVPVVNFYGSTEGTSLALIHEEGERSRKDWKYLSFHPRAGTEFRHHADDMYELYIVRHPDLEVHQQIFRTFPDLTEFRTRDLFRKHPTRPNMWSHCGRADDTIVFLTGEKVTPVEMEQYIFSQHPEINGILVAGAQRFQASLLIELVQKDEVSLEHKADLLERFWPTIEKVNARFPSHARIAKTHVTFVDSKRPMSRSPKGTIQRAATMIEYAKDLDILYANADKLGSAQSTTTCNIIDTECALTCLQTTVKKVIGQDLKVDDNFFMQGMDSLQAVLLLREIRPIFRCHSLKLVLFIHTQPFCP